MSLHEAANGILETHVTWQDVESEMQKTLGTTSKFGENKKATNISDLKGFMSRIALVEADWADKKDDEDLPDKFVVKVSTQMAMMNMTKMLDVDASDYWTDEKITNLGIMTRMFHNREVSSYSLLVKENNPLIPITKIYGSKAFDEENTLKGYIISEYFDNLQNMAMHESIPFEDLKPMVRSVAAFSAIGEKTNRDQLKFAGESDFLEIVFASMFDEKTVNIMYDNLRTAFPKEYHEKLEKMIGLYDSYYVKPEMVKKYKTLCEFLGYKPVLTHGDLWGSNLLCTREDGKVNLKAVIDWQTVSFTTPAQDVGRLFVACLTKKDRSGEKLNELLELYYNTFVEELHGKPVPYTFQQLVDSYNLFFPMMVILVLPGISMLLEHADIPEEYRESLRSSALEKMVGMMEDVIEIHESNITKFQEFYKF